MEAASEEEGLAAELVGDFDQVVLERAEGFDQPHHDPQVIDHPHIEDPCTHIIIIIPQHIIMAEEEDIMEDHDHMEEFNPPFVVYSSP